MMARVQVKGMLAKLIFDKNPDREFYIEESFPFDWLYPYLEPHGLIFKINHQPLPGLSDDIVRAEPRLLAERCPADDRRLADRRNVG